MESSEAGLFAESAHLQYRSEAVSCLFYLHMARKFVIVLFV